MKRLIFLIIILLNNIAGAKAATWIHITQDYYVYIDFHIHQKHFLYEEDSLKKKMFYGPVIPDPADSTTNLVSVEFKLEPDSTSVDFLFYTMYGRVDTQKEWFKIADISHEGAILIQSLKDSRILLARRINYEVKQNKQGDWELWDRLLNQKIIGLTPTGAANFKNNPEERSLAPIYKKEWAICREKIIVE